MQNLDLGTPLFCQVYRIFILCNVLLCFVLGTCKQWSGKRGAMDRASDYEYVNASPAWARATVVPNFCDASCAPEQGTLL